MKQAEVCIAGAGIIGLSLALELRRSGRTVLVLEKGAAMAEASSAAAGMLAANDPDNPPGLFALAQLSETLYPEFLQRIESLSGLSIPIRTRQTIQALPKEAVRHERRSWPYPVLSAEEIETIEPSFHPRRHLSDQSDSRTSNSWMLLEETSIDPRGLCAALPIAARRVGIEMREYSAWLPPPPSATRTKDRDIAEIFVDCRGAWAHSGLPAHLRPVKGQALTIALPGGISLRRTIRARDIYLVPRGDGRLLIGATVEEAGFDKSIDEGSITHLLARADELVPGLLNATVLDRWAGLRPATPDGLPLLGPIPGADPGQPARFIAAGHFRNGILLAPATALLMAQLLCGQPTDLDLGPFSPTRFAL